VPITFFDRLHGYYELGQTLTSIGYIDLLSLYRLTDSRSNYSCLITADMIAILQIRPTGYSSNISLSNGLSSANDVISESVSFSNLVQLH